MKLRGRNRVSISQFQDVFGQQRFAGQKDGRGAVFSGIRVYNYDPGHVRDKVGWHGVCILDGGGKRAAE